MVSHQKGANIYGGPCKSTKIYQVNTCFMRHGKYQIISIVNLGRNYQTLSKPHDFSERLVIRVLWIFFLRKNWQHMAHMQLIVTWQDTTWEEYSAGNFCFNKGLCVIWNEGTFSNHKLCEKSCHGLGFHSPIRYESDLSNEVLSILVG